MHGGVIAARTFNLLYVWLDLGWLVIFLGALILFRKYQALVVGLLAGTLYFAVDYGVFFRVLGTRVVTGADTFWLLLWMSFSYGITNFAWMWLLFEEKKNWVEWSMLIVSGWLAVALLSQNFGTGSGVVTTSRGTGTYHGVMALVLFAGYAILIALNLRDKRRGTPGVNLPWLLAIGVGIQLAWEVVLLLTGIRPAGIATLIEDSLIETNLGVPYAYWIFRAMNRGKSMQITKSL